MTDAIIMILLIRQQQYNVNFLGTKNGLSIYVDRKKQYIWIKLKRLQYTINAKGNIWKAVWFWNSKCSSVL